MIDLTPIPERVRSYRRRFEAIHHALSSLLDEHEVLAAEVGRLQSPSVASDSASESDLPERLLRELLAIIHRDDGEHTHIAGLKESTSDAIDCFCGMLPPDDLNLQQHLNKQ